MLVERRRYVTLAASLNARLQNLLVTAVCCPPRFSVGISLQHEPWAGP